MHPVSLETMDTIYQSKCQKPPNPEKHLTLLFHLKYEFGPGGKVPTQVLRSMLRRREKQNSKFLRSLLSLVLSLLSPGPPPLPMSTCVYSVCLRPSHLCRLALIPVSLLRPQMPIRGSVSILIIYVFVVFQELTGYFSIQELT